MRWAVLVTCVAAAGCEGFVDAGDAGDVDAGVDAGPVRPVFPPGFNDRSAGWPAGAHLVGAAVVESVLYAATPGGVQSLDSTSAAPSWAAEAVPLGAGEQVTSLLRVDRTVYLTAAGSGAAGGVLVKRPAEAWARLGTAPAGAAWQVVKKGAEVLLATGGALYAAPTAEGAWTRRTVGTVPLFAQRVTRLVTAPAQQRLFATGDAAAGLGGLAYSDDTGASWTFGLVAGDVSALAASGAVVLAEAAASGQVRSDNYGATFKAFAVGAPVTSFVFGTTRVWASTDAGVRASDDLGVSWVDEVVGLPAGPVRGVFVAGPMLIADTEGGPFIEYLQ